MRLHSSCFRFPFAGCEPTHSFFKGRHTIHNARLLRPPALPTTKNTRGEKSIQASKYNTDPFLQWATHLQYYIKCCLSLRKGVCLHWGNFVNEKNSLNKIDALHHWSFPLHTNNVCLETINMANKHVIILISLDKNTLRSSCRIEIRI